VILKVLLDNIDRIKPNMKPFKYEGYEVGWEDGLLLINGKMLDLHTHLKIIHEVFNHYILNRNFDSSIDVQFFLIKIDQMYLPEIVTIDLVRQLNKKSGLPMYALKKSLADIRKEKYK